MGPTVNLCKAIYLKGRIKMWPKRESAKLVAPNLKLHQRDYCSSVLSAEGPLSSGNTFCPHLLPLVKLSVCDVPFLTSATDTLEKEQGREFKGCCRMSASGTEVCHMGLGLQAIQSSASQLCRGWKRGHSWITNSASFFVLLCGA